MVKFVSCETKTGSGKTIKGFIKTRGTGESDITVLQLFIAAIGSLLYVF